MKELGVPGKGIEGASSVMRKTVLLGKINLEDQGGGLGEL